MDKSLVAEGLISGMDQLWTVLYNHKYRKLNISTTIVSTLHFYICFVTLTNHLTNVYYDKNYFLLIGTSVANPYCNSVGHSTLAPWMGEHTRVGKILPKTEFKKALKKHPDNIKHPPKNINDYI